MERLYYEDSYLTEFSAAVVANRDTPEGPGVALDRSAFYPEGGGQPDDRGEIGGLPVRAVREDADGTVWHYLAAGPAPAGRIEARLDWARRFDLMQQHTGQHLLSAAFLRVADAETVGFHLTEENLQIDLERPVGPEQLAAAEDLANLIIREDRAVTCRFVRQPELSGIAWRKPPAHQGPIRLVSVEEFDFSPCGGTHVRHASEVGLVKITGLERVRGGARVSFLCGGRALGDYRDKLRIVTDLVKELHAPPEQLREAVKRLREMSARSDRENAELRAALLVLEYERLRSAGEPTVRRVYQDRTLPELRELAARLAAAGIKAILARTDGGTAQLVVARPEGEGPDLAAILRAILAPVGGKGGGTAAFAQGGIRAEELPRVLEELELSIRS